MDPLSQPGVPLGWSATEIRERLDRGLVAIAAEGGRVHLSWRLLQSDEPGVAFNVYRGAGSSAVRLNAKPLQATTDYVDSPPPGSKPAWRVVSVVNGKEQAAGIGGWSEPPIQGYRALALRDDVTSVDRVGIGDLDGDGHFDFVVKHPAGNIDPGRRVPSKDTYRIDGTTAGPGRSCGASSSDGTSIRHLVLADGRARSGRRREGRGVFADGAVRGHARSDVHPGEAVRPGRPRVSLC